MQYRMIMYTYCTVINNKWPMMVWSNDNICLNMTFGLPQGRHSYSLADNETHLNKSSGDSSCLGQQQQQSHYFHINVSKHCLSFLMADKNTQKSKLHMILLSILYYNIWWVFQNVYFGWWMRCKKFDAPKRQYNYSVLIYCCVV